MRDLTERQQQVLDWIKGYIRRHGVPPSRLELARGLGLSEASSVTDHLKRLERAGWIQVERNKSRSIRLLDTDLPLIGPIAAVAAGTADPLRGEHRRAAASGHRRAVPAARGLPADRARRQHEPHRPVRLRYRRHPPDDGPRKRRRRRRPVRRRGDAESASSGSTNGTSSCARRATIRRTRS